MGVSLLDTPEQVVERFFSSLPESLTTLEIITTKKMSPEQSNKTNAIAAVLSNNFHLRYLLVKVILAEHLYFVNTYTTQRQIQQWTVTSF